MSYSPEEIKAFEEKDLRISKQAMLKALIKKLDLEEVHEPEKVCELSDKYVEYIYRVKPTVCSGRAVAGVQTCEKSDTINWTKEAELASVPVPNNANIKILNLIRDGYKKVNKGVEIAPNYLLKLIYNARGKYPTNKSSVQLVLKIIQETENE